MAKIKYILIPKSEVMEANRFYIRFRYPLEENQFFVLTRHFCKEYYNDKNYYLARLDLDKVDNHKIFEDDTDNEVGVMSDMNIFSLYEECLDDKADDFYHDDEIVKKEKNIYALNDQKEIESQLQILEKEIEINKLKLQNLRQKLNK